MAAGFLNVLKPPGMSSHDVVSNVRKIFRTKRVGHAGTLDPGAAGVLPVALGHAARLVEYISSAGKAYRLELLLGFSTDTGDDSGAVIESMRDFPIPSKAAVLAAMQKFSGTILQRPPVYSAIKLQGKRAYELARENQAVEMPLRQVTIHDLRLIEAHDSRLFFDLACSKGTYVRSFCRDFGEALGIPATMGFLLRTRVGSFCLHEAFSLEEIEQLGEEALVPAETAVLHLPRFDLAEHRVMPFFNGLSTGSIDLPSDEPLLRVYGKGRFLGIGRYEAAMRELYPVKVFRELPDGGHFDCGEIDSCSGFPKLHI